ncbi:MAG: response regulator [Planctomycetales bacterium]
MVDDQARIRESLQALLRSVHLRVVTCGSAQEFLDTYDPACAGCLVLDVRMPGMSGIQLQEELQARGTEIPIIFITGHGDVALAVQAMKGGAVEFLEKPLDHQRLLDCIHEAIERDRVQRLAAEARSAIRERIERLTRRERQVLEEVVAGRSSREIAAELAVSVKTVEAHRARIMRKMEAHSAAQLIHAWYSFRSR